MQPYIFGVVALLFLLHGLANKKILIAIFLISTGIS